MYRVLMINKNNSQITIAPNLLNTTTSFEL